MTYQSYIKTPMGELISVGKFTSYDKAAVAAVKETRKWVNTMKEIGRTTEGAMPVVRTIECRTKTERDETAK